MNRDGEPTDPPREPQRHRPDRADFDPDYDADAPVICEICGGTMRYTASCRITCPNCGYTRDCSDP